MKPRNAPLSSTSTSNARPAAINWPLRPSSRVLFSPALVCFGFRTESLRVATVVGGKGVGGDGVSKLCRGGAGAGESAAGGEPESGGAGAGSGVIGAGSGATGTESGTTGGGSCTAWDAESSPAPSAGPASAPGSTVSMTAIRAAQARGGAIRPLTNRNVGNLVPYVVLPPPRARAACKGR